MPHRAHPLKQDADNINLLPVEAEENAMHRRFDRSFTRDFCASCAEMAQMRTPQPLQPVIQIAA